jgi:structural hemagglutinin/hemolysin toxin protein RtxA
MYTLCFYVPASSLETVKAAVFAAGAGRIGNYDHCCWATEGQGQFRPLAGSNPAIGVQGEIEQLREYRVEMVCEEKSVRAVVDALIAAHPYEEPAWHMLETVTELPG